MVYLNFGLDAVELRYSHYNEHVLAIGSRLDTIFRVLF